MKKRNQHYIWRYYLDSWAKNKQIFCLRVNNIFKTNLKNIGSMRDFYKLKELNENDISLIKKLFLKDSNPILKKLNENWLTVFNTVFSLKRKLQQDSRKNTEIDSKIDKLIINFEEDLHATIENNSISCIDKLRNENVSFLKTKEELINFIYYLSVQYFRTNKIKTSVIKTTSKYPQFNIEKIWNISSHILATNFAYNLWKRFNYFRIILLKNNTIVPFITGDQPVINTFADYQNNENLNELELYYPLKPFLALLITQKAEIINNSILRLDENKIHEYNYLIFKASHEQIYANENNVLKKYIVYKSISSNIA